MNFKEEWMKTGRILKELENIKKNQTKLKNILTEMKDTLEGINSRNIKKKKRIKRNKNTLRNLQTTSSILTLQYKSPRRRKERERGRELT